VEMDARMPARMRAEAQLIWQPLLLRALIAAVFGAFTIFWQEPGPIAMAVSTGLYLVGSAAAVYLLRNKLRGTQAGAKSERLTQGLLRVTGLVLAVGGLLSVMFRTPGAYMPLIGATLLLAGVVEIVLGLRHRRDGGLGRDWLITGAVNAATALLLVLLPLFAPPEPHALLGVVGGSAIITAVLLILAGLGYRHDAAPGASDGPEAVN
jgi:uncharacterized membrane protein HdeD (DUF308 family)